MSRRIVLLLDGTSNEIETNRTNIVRLYGCLEKSENQVVWYNPGVGTMGAEHSWSPRYRKFVQTLGLATGWGLDRNVKDAYRFLAETYREGDEIYLFGFSRGAYTARVLAGFIHAVGLLWPINLNLLDYAYRAYKRISDDDREVSEADKAAGGRFAEVRLFERMLDPRRPMIRGLGLFDTVGSVIEMGRWRPVIRNYAFTVTNPSVESVRHAVAIDERRVMFRPTLWPRGVDYRCPRFNSDEIRPQDVEEVWFTGSHSDIGGGWGEERSHLAKIALEWMIERTETLGLVYDDGVVDRIVRGGDSDDGYEPPNPHSMPNESMSGFWPILEWLPRRHRPERDGRRSSILGLYLPRGTRRRIPAGTMIHSSVFDRRGTDADFNQPNIPTDHVVFVAPPPV